MRACGEGGFFERGLLGCCGDVSSQRFFVSQRIFFTEVRTEFMKTALIAIAAVFFVVAVPAHAQDHASQLTFSGGGGGGK